ncbi:NRDE family protein [Flavobacteriaceae bacterium MHTCC 0001]
MCTVTIFPTKNDGFVLTSNRDEAPNRVSISPEIYTMGSTKLLYPKDEVSGGTWIGVSETNRLVCVLNGGYKKHERRPDYRKSRGLVAKDFLIAERIEHTIATYDFKDIEPFTIIIADWNFALKFFELVWDGHLAHFTELPLEPKIWSSATLYSEVMKQEREHWFQTFMAENKLNKDAALTFHKTAGSGNTDYGVIMDRGQVKTTSITQVEFQNNAVMMRYENLLKNNIFYQTLQLKDVVNG